MRSSLPGVISISCKRASDNHWLRSSIHSSRKLAFSQNKKPGLFDRAFSFSIDRIGSGSFVRHRGVVAIDIRVDIDITFTIALHLSLGASARALGELAFDLLHRLGLRHVLHD